MIRRTLPVARMVSTSHGMRRILKQKGTVSNYIRQAVQSGVYRTQTELDQVWKERRESAEDLRTIMKRFRQDIVRGSAVHDYPLEYLILQQHPPVPDPPRTPKKLLHRMRPEPNPVEALVDKYLSRHSSRQRRSNVPSIDEEVGENYDDDNTAPHTTEDYYRRLLGVPSPRFRASGSTDPTSSSGSYFALKSAPVQKAYAAALHHYQLQRTTPGGMTDAEAMAAVDALLAEQEAVERQTARQRADAIVQEKTQKKSASASRSTPEKQREENAVKQQQEEEASTAAAAASAASGTTTVATIFHSNPSLVEGMMRWSERLQAVPYVEWTVGASTALDHWIARQVLGVSEETWLAVLEGSATDLDLLDIGTHIVAVRQALFPETATEDDSIQGDVPEDEIDTIWHDAVDSSNNVANDQKDSSAEKTVDELLAALGALRSPSPSSDTKPAAAAAVVAEEDDEDVVTERLVGQLQTWRSKHAEQDYEQWSAAEQEQFNHWLKHEYVAKVLLHHPKHRHGSSDEKVDYEETRRALLAVPPTTMEESNAFWEALQSYDTAEKWLLEHQPPAMAPTGAAAAAAADDDAKSSGSSAAPSAKPLPAVARPWLPLAFWQQLSRTEQVERLLNLGALRPILDEYYPDEQRQAFLQHYGHLLFQEVPLEHLVPDPEGPLDVNSNDWPAHIPKPEVTATDLGRYRLESQPYLADGVADDLLDVWNEHKANRAKYEERLFRTERLGLRYSDHMPATDAEWLAQYEQSLKPQSAQTSSSPSPTSLPPKAPPAAPTKSPSKGRSGTVNQSRKDNRPPASGVGGGTKKKTTR